MSCRVSALAIVIVCFIAFGPQDLVDARKRHRKEKVCSVKVAEDGRYSVVCIKPKTSRRVSKRGERHPQGKLTKPSKSKVIKKHSLKENLVKKTLEVRSVRKRWKRGSLRCKDGTTAWLSSETFPDNQLRARCLSKELLQGFSVQRLANKIRYKFTCCELTLFSNQGWSLKGFYSTVELIEMWIDRFLHDSQSSMSVVEAYF